MEHSHVVSLRPPKRPEPPQMEVQPETPRERSRKRRRGMPVTLITLIVLGGGAFAAYYYFFRQPIEIPNTVNKSPSAPVTEEARAKAVEEITDIVAAVGRHIVLPEGEQPTVATVSDPEKLKDQPFFAAAKVGHKVLIYTLAKKAYLYDPSIDKLIEVAPLTTYDQ